MNINDLTPDENNPRVATDAKLTQLKKTMLKLGDLSGIVYNRKLNLLVGGHQRRQNFDRDAVITITKKFGKPTRAGTIAEGYVELNGEKFSYREVSWNESLHKAAMIAANNNAGTWDSEKLSARLKELSEFDAGDFDLDLTMFDTDELKEYGTVTVGEHERKGKGGVDEDEVPEKAPARSKLGDLYLLGEHRLLCGDSTKQKTVERLMKGAKADLWITDVPYGVDYVAKNAAVHGGVVKNAVGKEIQNDCIPVEELKPFWRAIAESAHFATTNEASNYWFACQGPDKKMMMMMMMDEAGWNIRHELIWVKKSFVFGRCDYHYRHEPIIYGWKKKGKHNWAGDRSQSSVFEVDRPHKSDLHPTMKPIELLEHFVNNSSKIGGRVLDTCGGSGSTLIACEKTHRKCYMMEIDPHYVDVIVERWEKYTGEKARLVRPETKAPVKQARKQAANVSA